MKNLLLFMFVLIGTFQLTEAQCTRVAPFAVGPIGDYSISGNATLIFLADGSKTLSFDSNFSTTSGPDLHVYLSESTIVSTPGGVLTTPNTIEVGILKSATGSQSYDLTNLSPVVGLNDYSYVHVHCKMYDHYWGGATFAAESGVDCGNLSVDLIEEDLVLIYPTLVTQNSFYIELKSNLKANIFLYSLVGELIERKIGVSDEINSIETRNLPNGIYILQVQFDGKVRTQKIIIER